MKGRWLVLLFCVQVSTVFGWGSKEVFSHYPNKYFVETGTYRGEGVRKALSAGFKDVYSIELSPYYYKLCVGMFAKQKNVHLYFGDSAKELVTIIQQLNAPITFWLDGHCSMGNTARGDTMTPLMKELEAIKRHPIKTHTILIDDVRQFGTADFDWLSKDEVIKKIMEINPSYTIKYEDGYRPKDVLVAYIDTK